MRSALKSMNALLTTLAVLLWQLAGDLSATDGFWENDAERDVLAGTRGNRGIIETQSDGKHAGHDCVHYNRHLYLSVSITEVANIRQGYIQYVKKEFKRDLFFKRSQFILLPPIHSRHSDLNCVNI